MYRADLSRRIGPAFADAAVDAAMDSLDKHGYPAGWGTSPRPAPTADNGPGLRPCPALTPYVLLGVCPKGDHHGIKAR